MSYEINCSQGDDFTIQSEDEDEVIAMAQEHAEKHHNMELEKDDTRDILEQTGS